MAAELLRRRTRTISPFMSEENENQPPVQTDAPADRPRHPRRRFPRRRNRGPQEQRDNFNVPGDRGDGATAEQTSDAARVNEGDQREEGASPNGESERDPEYGDGISGISGRGLGMLRGAKRTFVKSP